MTIFLHIFAFVSGALSPQFWVNLLGPRGTYSLITSDTLVHWTILIPWFFTERRHSWKRPRKLIPKRGMKIPPRSRESGPQRRWRELLRSCWDRTVHTLPGLCTRGMEAGNVRINRCKGLLLDTMDEKWNQSKWLSGWLGKGSQVRVTQMYCLLPTTLSISFYGKSTGSNTLAVRTSRYHWIVDCDMSFSGPQICLQDTPQATKVYQHHEKWISRGCSAVWYELCSVQRANVGTMLTLFTSQLESTPGPFHLAQKAQ